MRTKYKQWAVDYVLEHPQTALEKIDFSSIFFTSKNIVFEVGSGKGDFIVMMAKKHPENNYLAIEKVKTVAGMLTRKIMEQELENIRVFPNDVAILFDEIKQGFVHAIYLNFVDPWPKKKHAKRRLTFITFLEQYYRVLKDGGYLYFKSDNDGLYEFSKEELQKTKFKIISDEEDYAFDENEDAMTEYEAKFRNKGQKIHRIVIQK